MIALQSFYIYQKRTIRIMKFVHKINIKLKKVLNILFYLIKYDFFLLHGMLKLFNFHLKSLIINYYSNYNLGLACVIFSLVFSNVETG